MRLFTVIFERIPMVWFLLGLLFISIGLYLGYQSSLTFLYIVVGLFCCAYGVALFVFRLQARPKASAATRLSPHFISSGSEASTPSISSAGNGQTAEHADSVN